MALPQRWQSNGEGLVLDDEYLRSLPCCEAGCEESGAECEIKAALLWLNQQSDTYRSKREIRPLTPIPQPDKPKRFMTFSIRLGRKRRRGTGTRVRRIEYTLDGETTEAKDEPSSGWIAEHFLTRKLAGSLLITSGQKRHTLETFLEAFGPELCENGYDISPRFSNGIAFLDIRKDKRSWKIVYAESVTGSPPDTLLGYARDVMPSLDQLYLKADCRLLFRAIGAYQELLLNTFGVALSPTAGMIALRCARRFLPDDFRKWRPTPLLQAMERDGKGYRGGIVYGTRYKGPAWKIDVTRQYTAHLTADLPYKAAFGRYVDRDTTPHGVFLCFVQLSSPLPYPMGVWNGAGFQMRTMPNGGFVSILHTPEIAALERIGATITPSYGYIFTHTFSFGPLVQRLQEILDMHGRESNIAKLTKPIGNFVYGKLGQNPEHSEMLFTATEPDLSWFPYVDDTGTSWATVWERNVRRDNAGHHIDIAATIAAAARGQTLNMWRVLQSKHIRVLRCCTDSLTTTHDPSAFVSFAESKIGGWRLESEMVETIIVNSYAYIDKDGAHVNGISHPTVRMVEQAYDGTVSTVVQTERLPLRGFVRGSHKVTREIRVS